MSSHLHKPSAAPRKRRYLVHLSCLSENGSESCRYVVRIRPWSDRGKLIVAACERTFADDCELVAVVNPLLPPGSDIRYVLSHIENPSGFLYLLRLTDEEALQLGWRK